MFRFLFLFPFTVLYDLATRVRNYLYNTGRRGSVSFDANVIGIGNLSVGGTGKTPHVEYLIRLLKSRYKIATLSRGYGRKTKGFILANENSTAATIGDEPFQYYHKYGDEITVAVGEERALAIPSILLEKPETKIILLDDAYQHRSVHPLLTILLSDYHHPFYNDYVLPYGRLREARKGADRADIIIVSKCPDSMSDNEQQQNIQAIRRYVKSDVPIFFTGIRYGNPIPIFENETDYRNKQVILFTGIANASLLEKHVREKYTLVKHLSYSDHHSYTENDSKNIISTLNELNKNNDHILLTTEKDMVKLLSPSFKKQFQKIPLFYLPIEIYFLKEKEMFESLVVKKGIIF